MNKCIVYPFFYIILSASIWCLLLQFCHHINYMGSNTNDKYIFNNICCAQGKISEAQVDSFNLPMYVPSLEEMMELVQKNGCFDIEKMELTSPGVHASMTNTSSMGKAIVMHVRAGMERMLIQHFGSEIIDELFNRYAKKFEEFPHHVLPSKKVQLFVVLKRKWCVLKSLDASFKISAFSLLSGIRPAWLILIMY